MNLLFGTSVYTSDDEEIGKIKELILDSRSREVTHLVIQRGLLFENDQIIPVNIVAAADSERVSLTKSAGNLESFTAEFRSEDYVSSQIEPPAREAAPQGLYWARPPGTPPSLIPSGLEQVGLPPDVSIPEDDIMLVHGTSVTTSDDQHVGRVTELITDDTDRLSHVRIEDRAIYPEPKLIPVDWIQVLKDNQIVLSVEKEAVDQLPAV